MSSHCHRTWSNGKLQDLVFFQRGFDITKAEQKEGDIPVISSSGVTSYHSEAKVSGPGIIIGRKGSLGTVHYSEGPYWPHDTTLWSKDIKGNNPRYIYYFLKTLGLERFDVGNSNPTLNRNHIHDMVIKIPSKDIQQKIVEILTPYDDLIENNRRRIQLLEEAARLLYQEWFVRLRFPGHEHTKIVDGVPEGWTIKTAYEVMDICSGGTPKTSIPDYWNGDIPFFTPKDVKDNLYTLITEKNITENGLKNCNSKLYPKDTIFITARGTVGKTCLAQTDMAMNQSCYALISKKPLTQYFLLFALREGISQIQNRAVGSVFDAIIVDTFKLIPFLVPSENLIQLFSDNISTTIHQIDTLIMQNIKLQEARDLLLPRLMNGGIPV